MKQRLAIALVLASASPLWGAALPCPDEPLPEGAVPKWGSRRWVVGLGTGALAISPTGKVLAVSEEDRSVFLLDTRPGLPRTTIRGVQKGLRVAFSPDGSRLATVGSDSQVVRLWRMTRIARMNTDKNRILV